MFSESNWLLELPFFTVKVLRRLTGIRDVPGMMGDLAEKIELMLNGGNQVQLDV
jgi:hypothetical protein